MQSSPDLDLQPAVRSEFVALADLLESLPDAAWDTPSLCAGWRTREVVAHLTMPVRYQPDQFMAELQACGGDFTRLSNVIAERDATLGTPTLVANLRDDSMHAWTPPGGGRMGALIHVVIHGADITVPLGLDRRTPDETTLVVLEELTTGGGHAHFGVHLDGCQLAATDLDWHYGSGPATRATASELAVLLCGREVFGTSLRRAP